MKRLGIFYILLLLGLVWAPISGQAQDLTMAVTEIETSRFWVAVIAGIMLAMGLQTVLFAISVATGLTMTPDLKEKAAEKKAHSMAAADRDFLYDDKEDEQEEEKRLKDGHALSVKLTNSFGVWSTITTSIALFLASFLAVKMGMVNINEQGVIIGLVIWAAFFTLITYLEWRSVRSLMGGMIHLARTGLATSGEFLQSVFGKSEKKRAEDFGRHSVRAIYEEMSDIAHKDHLDKKLRRYLEELRPQKFNYDKIHDDLVELLNEIRIEENIDVSQEDVTRILSLKLEKDHKIVNADNARKLKDTVKKAVHNARTKGTLDGKAIAMMETLAPMPDEEAHAYLQKVAKLLRKTGRSELDPDALRRDLASIIKDPLSGTDVIRARLALMNRDTIKALLAQQEDMDADKAGRVVDRVMEIVSSLREEHGAMEEGGAPSRELSEKAKGRIESFMDALHMPDINYESIKMDVRDILHDPKAAPRILKIRLAQLDRNNLREFMENNIHLSHEQTEKIVDQILETRDTVSETVGKLQDRVVAKYERTRRRTVIMAEHLREASMAAAWWIVIAAVVSALAASAGGWLGTTTI